MSNEPNPLIHHFFERSLKVDEKDKLENLLLSSPEARKEFRKISEAHGLLNLSSEMAEGGAAAATDLLVPLHPRSSSSNAPPIKGLRVALIGWSSLAACVGLSFGISHLLTIRRTQPMQTPTLPGLASITSTAPFDWATDSSLPRNGQIDAALYHLSFGTLRFEMSAGAAVCVSAPCEFEILSGKEIRVSYGRLTARLPNDEDELIIKMPGLKLTDLGTGFGVDVEREGTALVSVFEGKVRLDKDQRETPTILKAGRSMRLTAGKGSALNRSSFDPTPFRDLWPLTLGVDDLSDLIQFVPPSLNNRRLLMAHQSRERVFLMPEKQGVILDKPLLSDLSLTETSWPNSSEISSIPSGTRVSSYLLFYNPPKGVSIPTVNLTGTVTFNRKILGIICTAETLSLSDKVLEADLLDNNLIAKRQLESVDGPGGDLPHDSLNLSSDRRSIHFDFSAREGIDNIRILLTEE